VLELMRDAGLIDAATFASNKDRELGVVTAESRRAAYYPAFMDLVRRQLRRDYDDEDAAQPGRKVYTTLEPMPPAAAEQALGGKRTGFDGFTRALDARRQIGSLVKPAVHLAALEMGRYSLATQIDDVPVTLELDDGRTWSPRNFEDEANGQVTAVRALAESLNLATVNLGLEIGLERVARTLERLGVEPRRPLYPSLLLGAIELTPYEVAELYTTIANGGFRTPLKAVRAVVDGRGRTLRRYALEIEQVASPESIYELNQGLVQVMRRGTGAPA